MDFEIDNITSVSTATETPESHQCLDDEKLSVNFVKLKFDEPKVLFIEPFYGGSHKQLFDLLIKDVPHTLVTLSAKKWHWRARCSALVLSELIPRITTETVLFCSSVTSLAELLGIRPDLQKLKKIVYFHENQFIYPVRQIKDRDVQFAYNEITTCLAADKILFNSQYNQDTLLNNLGRIVKLLPDYRPKNLLQKIAPKCSVLYFPVYFPVHLKPSSRDTNILHIAWPHRWEFDKDPQTFFKVCSDLINAGCDFKLHVLGERFQDVPDVFKTAEEELGEHILQFGYAKSKEDYYAILSRCHVAVSTAKHEFFGVAMLEATYCGCLPLVPNSLVYPEIYPKVCLYEGEIGLFKMLFKYCSSPNLAVENRNNFDFNISQYSAEKLLPTYFELLNGVTEYK